MSKRSFGSLARVLKRAKRMPSMPASSRSAARVAPGSDRTESSDVNNANESVFGDDVSQVERPQHSSLPFQLIILVGALPTVSTSSFVASHYEAAAAPAVSDDEEAPSYKTVCRDRLRQRRFPSMDAKEENVIEHALRKGHGVIVDNLNASRERRKHLIRVAKRNGAKRCLCVVVGGDANGAVQCSRRLRAIQRRQRNESWVQSLRELNEMEESVVAPSTTKEEFDEIVSLRVASSVCYEASASIDEHVDQLLMEKLEFGIEAYIPAPVAGH